VQGGVGPGIVQFDPVGYSTLLGTAFFALEGSPFVLPIQHAMARKDHFPRVTIWSGIMVGTIYLSFGVVGYLGTF
jgi:amino acid permease